MISQNSPAPTGSAEDKKDKPDVAEDKKDESVDADGKDKPDVAEDKQDEPVDADGKGEAEDAVAEDAVDKFEKHVATIYTGKPRRAYRSEGVMWRNCMGGVSDN